MVNSGVPLSAHLTEQHLSALRHELSIQRDLRGLTYDDLAELSGISRRTLVAIEVGTSRGSVESWLHICEALGTTFAQFVGDSVDAHVADIAPQSEGLPEVALTQ